MWMDQAPRGFNLLLVRVARGVALLTLLGWGPLAAFLFGVISADLAAPLMAGCAGMKLIHDAMIAFVRYRLGQALYHVSFFDVAISPITVVLLFGSILVQVFG